MRPNLRLGLKACRTAAGLGADLVLFPELWQIAYTDCPADSAGRRRWAGIAVTSPPQPPFLRPGSRR